ncbi:hypothetical protein B0T10DRAFT_69804 [Thelonectria olida]|uniref:Uncharacterized protein n=1 Tax=Thelonectria olida TaxID=1576542 RepID=A0A9P9APK1_9HYPO|nr:hypothetical protein B0T10DRAFT_69804 [Thelonectria olida]
MHWLWPSVLAVLGLDGEIIERFKRVGLRSGLCVPRGQRQLGTLETREPDRCWRAVRVKRRGEGGRTVSRPVSLNCQRQIGFKELRYDAERRGPSKHPIRRPPSIHGRTYRIGQCIMGGAVNRKATQMSGLVSGCVLLRALHKSPRQRTESALNAPPNPLVLPLIDAFHTCSAPYVWGTLCHVLLV